MADSNRSVLPWIGAALTLVAAVACSTPDQPPAPNSTSSTTPFTAPPLDVSRYLAEPCSGVPNELSVQLGLPNRKSEHDEIIVNAGEQAECELSGGPPPLRAAAVRFYPRARPLPLVSGPGSRIKLLTISGYPAGEWVLSTGADGSFTSCQYIVDIAEAQGFGTLYNGPSGEPIETSCAHARQLTEGVIAAIPR